MNYELQIDQFQTSMTNTLSFDHQNMITYIDSTFHQSDHPTGAGKSYF